MVCKMAAGETANSAYSDHSISLTHYILVVSSIVICWTSPLVTLVVSGLFVAFILFLIEIMLAKNVDPDQMPHYVAFRCHIIWVCTVCL